LTFLCVDMHNSNVAGMIERESHHSWLPLMSLSVQWIH